eukprot:GFKZ01002191.1.p1 GENE.GFKZ01002191.1~~GFKZ01002191.1.p1  ORF type:complete len:285 (+),score=27.02 GFKZ01002191.1:317-1171(+)
MPCSTTRLCFSPPVAHAARRSHVPFTFPRRPSISTPSQTTLTRRVSPSLPDSLSLIQLARLRRHLIRLSRAESDQDAQSDSPTPRKANFSDEERAARSERLRAKWRDPEWRAAMMARRKSEQAVAKRKETARRMWKDPAFRLKMREARLGRVAWNKGISPSPTTRLRMSVTRKGVPRTEETKRKMSASKLQRPEDDDWPRLISESKKGKTKEYFQLRREFRALHRDLKLWSDSYRSKYGKLPSASTYERFVAPMMVFRIRRYLVLKESFGSEEAGVTREIITQN